MPSPRISIISAIAREDRAIGKNNALLWNIPEDMRHFRELTSGHTVVMGENTFYSIGKPLPNRTNIVISFNQELKIDGCIVTHSVDEALQIAKQSETQEVFIIGGASIYKQFIPLANRLYLTLVEGKYEADTFFPEYSDFTKMVSEEEFDNGKYKFTFVTLEKE